MDFSALAVARLIIVNQVANQLFFIFVHNSFQSSRAIFDFRLGIASDGLSRIGLAGAVKLTKIPHNAVPCAFSICYAMSVNLVAGKAF